MKIFKNRKKVFTEIYAKNLWGGQKENFIQELVHIVKIW